MKTAYYQSFARKNIKDSSWRAGCWPFNPLRLIATLIPQDVNNAATLVVADVFMNLDQ